MAAFTLVCSLTETLVRTEIISQTQLNDILELAAQRNENVPETESTTNSDAALLLRSLLKE